MLRTPGVDQTTGSLGQGLSCSVGHAIGLKLRQSDSKVYCIVGDGELQEGQCWEAFMLAGNRKLDNLVVICDRNHGQVDGTVEEIGDIEPLDAKLEAFKFKVYDIPGHDVEAISDAIDRANTDAMPSFIIAKPSKPAAFRHGGGRRFAQHRLLPTAV
jgi:transketolase